MGMMILLGWVYVQGPSKMVLSLIGMNWSIKTLGTACGKYYSCGTGILTDWGAVLCQVDVYNDFSSLLSAIIENKQLVLPHIQTR